MSFKLTDFITVTSTGNVGIGTTSPNRNLSIVSTTDTSVEIKSGTANQSSLWFSDTDDGNIGGIFYTHNDNGMEFRVNDSTRLTITSGGNVGIGGTPSYTLHVSGNIIAVEDSTPALRLIGGTTSFDLKSDGGVFKVRDVSSGNELYHIAAGASGYHNWYINDSLKMTLDSSGNVGIGVTPTYKLDVGGSSAVLRVKETSGTDVRIVSGGSIGYIGTYTDHELRLLTNGTEKLTISNGGDVGIGITPTSKLTLLGTSTAASNTPSDAIVDIRGTSTAHLLMGVANVSPYGAWINTDSTTQPLVLMGTGGNVGIGTDNPSLYYSGADNLVVKQASGAGGISVVTDTSSEGSLYFADGTSGDEQYRGGIAYNHSSDNLLLVSGGAAKLTITSTGAIAVGSSSTNYGSSGQVLTSNGNASPSWTSTSGAKGEPGTTGAQGTAGSNGSNGAQGTAGTNGSNGSNGAVGSQGTNGSTGAQGAVGLNGGTGAQGATGATGGSGGTGAQGTAGTNGSNGGTGAQGATGATGGSGGTGAQGSTGSNGGTGAQGTAGSNGSNGNNGAQGITGAQGSTGSTGSNGSNGGTGAQGTSGVATFPYSGTATFSNQIRLSNSDGYIYGGTITTRLGSRAIDMGYNGSCYFQANRTDSSSAQFLCGSATSMTGIWSRVGTTNGGVSYDSGPRVFKITMGTTVRMQMDTNGVITGDFNDISDILFKKNIEFHGYGLVAVNSLKPREFNWKQINRPQEKQIGFIAQEVEEIIPEVIHGFDGNKSINGTGLISILTKAIQELSQEVTTLKAEVELLKQQ